MRLINIAGVDFPLHTLKDGRTILITSKHGYRFSDGTDCLSIKDGEGILSYEYVGTLEVKMMRKVKKLKPFKATKSMPIPTTEAYKMLDAIHRCKEVDAVLVSYVMVSALENSGHRERYHKALGFNSTKETSRMSNPQDKIVDVDNWAW
jgi:hypothetical protein